MNFIRNHLPNGAKVGDDSGGEERYHGPMVYINPGQVEEAAHYMEFHGAIDLSELTFNAFPYPDSDVSEDFGVESFLDIAVFEIPDRCSSRSCDLSEFGVGMQTYFNGMTFLNLCQGGRLAVDHNKFHGLLSSLMVPMEGSMPEHIVNGRFPVPEKNHNFEVMIANCNQNGRRVSLSGQVVFEIDDDPLTKLSVASEVKLTLVALAVCMIFTMLSVRVRRGTYSDYIYRLANVEEDRTDSQQAQQPQQALEPQNSHARDGDGATNLLQGATIV
jgi:hypothetical protein